MSLRVRLPVDEKTIEQYVLRGTPTKSQDFVPPFNRIAYAAAHVVADPILSRDPQGPAVIDWDSTMAFRRHLWTHGFGIAEAMDTAQRGLGLDWLGAQELIRRSIAESKAIVGADLICGVGTDHLETDGAASLDDVVSAYSTQFEFVEKHGGRAVMMASRMLARIAVTSDDYREVYGRVLSQAQQRTVLHWLGESFDTQLCGYWGEINFEQSLDVVLSIICDNRSKIDGIKISLLDKSKEIALRDRLPDGVVCFTGDDFNYTEMLEDDRYGRHSHALLGIFDAIAPQASRALSKLAAGDINEFRSILEPTVALSRKIFETPTQFYKAGIVFLAWLNRHQSHFIMPAGLQSTRSVLHYCEIFRLADQANVLDEPDVAAARMRQFLHCAGVNQ
ncbi:MAG: dihydrodipicolinate synthase family protein [Hyphomicrobiales bacterium]|nr:MAG: dihydrodipicolinate synthase family protein [Hyphomicrobiales bacterium]